MKKSFKILIPSFAVSVALFGFANFSFAQSALLVEFEKTPLFEGADIAPGYGVSRTVKITNNSDAVKDLITLATNFGSCESGCLADVLTLTITDEDSSYFAGTLKSFYSTEEVSLGSLLGNGESKTFTYTVYFPEDSGNDFQNKSTSFDLSVGFSGGEVISDNSLIAIGGSGGSSGGSRHLFIFNERNGNLLPDETEIDIYWSTNIPATSQVVYGPASGSYVLDLEDENFGYPFATPEIITKTLDHSVIITGLLPGTYVYRVVSRASPPTISYERKFTVPTSSLNSSVLISNSEGDGGLISEPEVAGEILGDATGNEEENPRLFDERNVAAVLASGLENWWWIILIILMILGYFTYRYYIKAD